MPFANFLTIIDFDSKFLFGGIGANITVLITFILITMSIFRHYYIGLPAIVLIFIVLIYFYKGLGGGLELIAKSGQIPLFTLCYFQIGYVYVKSKFDFIGLVKLLKISLLSAAILGIIHYYFFYDITFIDIKYAMSADNESILFIENYELNRFRETSIYFGANSFAYMLCIGISLSGFVRAIKKISNLNYLLSLFILLWALYITNSRSGLIIGSIIIIIYSYPYFKQKININKYFIIGMLTVIAVLINLILNNRFSLYEIISDPRMAKNILGLQLFYGNQSNWLIGSKIDAMMSDDNGVSVSDNMYINVLHSSGAIGIMLYIIFFKKVLNIKKKHLNTDSVVTNEILTLLYVVISLFLLSGLFSNSNGFIFLFSWVSMLCGSVISVINNNISIDNNIDLEGIRIDLKY